MGGRCEYRDKVVSDRRLGVVLQFECGPPTPHCKKPACYETLHEASDLDFSNNFYVQN